MASIPQGWTKSVEDDSVYVASVRIKDKVDIRTTQKYTIKVNNQTGGVDLYYPTTTGDKLFHRYDPTLDKWIIPKDTDYDATDYYLKALKSAGSDDFEKLKSTAKTGSVKIINSTSSPEDKDSISDKPGYKSTIQNTDDSPDERPDDEKGDGVPAPTKEDIKALESVDFSKGNYRKKYKNLRYPLDLSLPDSNKPNRDSSDVIEFEMKSYGNKKFRTDTFGLTARDFGEVLGRVTMAIPSGITDSNTVNWSDEEFSILDQTLASMSSDIINNGGNGIESIIKKAQIAADNPSLQQALITLAAQEAASTKNLLSRLNGAVFNPNIELLFKGPLLRDFSYTFDLTPRSKPEAEQIRSIIRFFKEGMAVQRDPEYLFLKAPNVFEIKYRFKQGSSDHPYLNMIKGPCALSQFTVDYTPQNTYMTTIDGSMISYRINMTFKELEPIYADDYLNLKQDDTLIGF